MIAPDGAVNDGRPATPERSQQQRLAPTEAAGAERRSDPGWTRRHYSY